MKNCLGPVFAQVDDLQQNGIEVDGIHYKVIWYMNYFMSKNKLFFNELLEIM